MQGVDVFTIGHGNLGFERLASLLAAHEVATLVDVRSMPYSRHFGHFNKRALEESLPDRGLKYVFLGRQLGGRPVEKEFYDSRGRVDYDLFSRTPSFVDGLNLLAEEAARAATAIMCAEENPRRCHRYHLITPALLRLGARVHHLRAAGFVETEDTPRSFRGGQLELFSQ